MTIAVVWVQVPSSALCKRKSQVLGLDSFFFDFRSESMTAVFLVVDNVLEILVKKIGQIQDVWLKAVMLICVACGNGIIEHKIEPSKTRRHRLC